MFVGLMAFYSAILLAVFIALIVHPRRLSDRACNAISAGVLLFQGFLGVLILEKSFGAAHLVLAVPVIAMAAVFALGYLTPKVLRRPVESWVKQALDYKELTAPEGALPWVRRTRSVLDWLGLSV